MRAQPTSAIALNEAERGGKLNGKRFEVARAFKLYGPGTSAEVLKAAGLDGNRNLMRARVTELADEGMITQHEARKCKVTGRKAIVWSYETCEPRPKMPTNAEMRERIAELEAAIAAEADWFEGYINSGSGIGLYRYVGKSDPNHGGDAFDGMRARGAALRAVLAGKTSTDRK